MHNEHHFYHTVRKSGRRIAAEPFPRPAVATGPRAVSPRAQFDRACSRLEKLLPQPQFVAFVTTEVYGAWDEMTAVVNAKIAEIERQLAADELTAAWDASLKAETPAAETQLQRAVRQCLEVDPALIAADDPREYGDYEYQTPDGVVYGF